MTLKVHEWINKIPTVPIYYLVKPLPRERAHCPYLLSGKPQPRERVWQNQWGKKTLLSLALV